MTYLELISIVAVKFILCSEWEY